MRKAIVRIVRFLMRLTAVYSFILAGACLLLAGRSAVRLFIFNRDPNDSASGLDPIGVLLGLAGALVFMIIGRWVWKTARAFGGTRPPVTIWDRERPTPASVDNHQDKLL